MRSIDPIAVGLTVGPVGLRANTMEPIRRVERTALSAALAAAEDETLEELDFVRRMLARAVDAAKSCDPQAIQEVVDCRDEAERRYEDAHARLLALIALQQPVATDLRLAMALVHINDR